jgi:hypothetical protein
VLPVDVLWLVCVMWVRRKKGRGEGKEKKKEIEN